MPIFAGSTAGHTLYDSAATETIVFASLMYLEARGLGAIILRVSPVGMRNEHLLPPYRALDSSTWS